MSHGTQLDLMPARTPSPAARRSVASAAASACSRLPAWSASRCTAAAILAADGAGAPGPAPSGASAKHVIFLFMNGGLSQVDSFDPEADARQVPRAADAGRQRRHRAQDRHADALAVRLQEVRPERAWMSASCSRTSASCADDICFIRSMYTDIPNHEPSMLMMNTGHTQVGRPSIGSWLTYGLGTENKNLPGFVVLCPDMPTTVGPPLWNSAFLPAVHQGTYHLQQDREARTSSSARTSIRRSWSPSSTTRSSRCAEQRRELDLLARARSDALERETVHDPQLEAAISRWKSPIGCRPRRPTCSTSARRARRR